MRILATDHPLWRFRAAETGVAPNRPKSALVPGLVGGVLGLALWAPISLELPELPVAVRFVVSFLVFTIGPGASIGLWMLDDLEPVEVIALLPAFGMAMSPVLAALLARLHVAQAFPHIAAALFGAGLTVASRSIRRAVHRTDGRTWLAIAVLLTVAVSLGAAISAHRLEESPSGILVFGDYDGVDLSYYAAITAELSHKIPPDAPFYAGHPLNYSYYPQLLLATLHRYGDVPILDLYFRYAWPAFLGYVALAAFVFVRRIATMRCAVLATTLLLVGGDFSYLFAWFFHPISTDWDYLLWPTNFFAATMEVLHFSTWTPTLPAFFAALYCYARYEDEGRWPWLVGASLCISSLIESKPFAFAVVIGALTIMWLWRGHDAAMRRRSGQVLIGALLCATPFALRIALLYGASRSHLAFELLRLPRQMLWKVGATRFLGFDPDHLGVDGLLRTVVVLTVATLVMFLVGVGPRWIGVRAVGRALGPGGRPIWRLLGWCVVLGALIPCVVATEPYHDTLQFYQVSLFLLWIFTAQAIDLWAAGRARVFLGASILVVLIALPSSLHFVREEWRQTAEAPLALVTPEERQIASYLRDLDHGSTVIMHDRPSQPSALAILSEQHTVLAWSNYVTGSLGRRADVEWFFKASARDPERALAILRLYHVTHIIERPGDHISPQITAALTRIRGSQGITLYEVPPDVRVGT